MRSKKQPVIRLKDGSLAGDGQRVRRWSKLSKRYKTGTVATVILDDNEQDVSICPELWSPLPARSRR